MSAHFLLISNNLLTRGCWRGKWKYEFSLLLPPSQNTTLSSWRRLQSAVATTPPATISTPSGVARAWPKLHFCHHSQSARLDLALPMAASFVHPSRFGLELCFQIWSRPWLQAYIVYGSRSGLSTDLAATTCPCHEPWWRGQNLNGHGLRAQLAKEKRRNSC